MKDRKDQKITFIALPSPFLDNPALNPLLGLCYLSSYIKNKGYQNIELVDYNILTYDYFENFDYLKEIPLDSDYYCITCMTTQYKWLYEICGYIKQNNDKAKIITGGPHSSNVPEDCLIDCKADVACIGEGEELLYDVLEGKPLDSIKGAAYLEDGIVKNRERCSIKNLDSLPFPDRNVIDINRYNRTLEGEDAFHIVTLRGCPFSCYYCDRFSVGRNVRYRSVENVMDEVKIINDEYGVNSFIIYDDIFTLSTSRVKIFCEEFKKRKVTWRCWVRANTMDREKAAYMSDSGLTQVTMGVESFDDTVLKGMGKGATAEQNRNALLICKEFGIKAQCSLMYGNPGETRESVENTIRAVEEIQPDNWDLTVLTPIPGSSIFHYPEKHGVTFDRKWLKDNLYFPCARTGSDNGIGNLWVEIDSMTKTEFVENMKYFTRRLEEVKPRPKKWKHYQKIKVEKLGYDGSLGRNHSEVYC